jgi:hypothetical protein
VGRIAVLAVAIVIAATGVAYAAGTITGSSIKDGTLTGKDVKNHSLTPKDFKGSVRGKRGRTGPPGAQGPIGPRGATGPAGPSGLSGLNTVSGVLTVDAGGIDGGTVSCPAGQRVVSGGFANEYGVVFVNAPNEDRTGWVVALDNSAGPDPAELDAYALCAGAGKAVAAKAPSRKLAPIRGRHYRRLLAKREAS